MRRRTADDRTQKVWGIYLRAVLADGAEIGCGAVLNPGTVIGRNSRVYPLVSVRGCIPAGYLVKGTDRVEKILYFGAE